MVDVSSLLILVAPTPFLLLVVPSNMLGKTLDPLHGHGVVEPELLLCGRCGVRAHAADIGRMLLAALDAALP